MTDTVLGRPSHPEHTIADGTKIAAISTAGRTLRCTANENRAKRPAIVPNVDNVPSKTHASATPNGQRLRHHKETQHRAPNAASMATCPGVI